MIRILIGGDLCPIGDATSAFERGEVDALFRDLMSEFRRADLSIVNLECPFISKETPIKKIGPVLGAGDSCINGIRQAGIDVLNLANNHIMDHGPDGLKNTLMTCEKFGIAHVGAGENIDAARRILVREIKGTRIGILSIAEREFSIATRTYWGANPLDIIDFVRNIRAHREEFDYLIVLLHGGNEGYPYPSPFLMNTCRFFVEEGANAVVCQHSHVAGCYETYHDAPIVYGQGNLIFDNLPGRDKSWNEGFLVNLEIDQNHKSKMVIVPYTQFDSCPGTIRMQGNQEREFLAALRERSESILNEAFVEKQWSLFCRGKKRYYLNTLSGNSPVIQKLVNKLRFPQLFRSKRSLRWKLALIRCESHREVLIKILSEE